MSTNPSPPTSTLEPNHDLLINYFGEVPNEDAAIAAMSLYILVTLVSLVITWRTRAWFMLAVPITGALEVAGFAARLVVIRNPSRNIFIIMECLLIISPVILAIVGYVMVGKLLAYSDYDMPVLRRWTARAFTASDIFCLMLQGGGGAMLAEDGEGSMETGERLLLAGLYIQLGFFTMFAIMLLVLHINPKFGFRHNKTLLGMFVCFYSTICLMYVRHIFRVIEFNQGWRGHLKTHEEYMYILDFVPIYLCFVLFCVFHYGFYINILDQQQAAKKKAMGADVESAGGSGSGSQGSQGCFRKGSVVPTGTEMVEAGREPTPENTTAGLAR